MEVGAVVAHISTEAEAEVSAEPAAPAPEPKKEEALPLLQRKRNRCAVVAVEKRSSLTILPPW